MRQRLLVLVLAASCIILGVAAVFVRMGQDHTPPEITVKKAEITYTEGEDYKALLEGVSAKDNVDGDLSDEIFVDRIVPTGDDSAVVYYGVMDKHNNVGTAKRKITYYAKDNETEEQMENPSEEEQPAEEVPQEPVPEGLQPNGNIPVIALNTDQAFVPAGTEFDLLSVVQDAADDIDGRESLFQRISVDGWYDLNTPGAYELHYYVTDSEGNVSEPCTLILNVQ